MDAIEEVLQKYDIDPTACTQRVICATVKVATENVINGHGSSSDKIIDGLTRYVFATCYRKSFEKKKRFLARTGYSIGLLARQRKEQCKMGAPRRLTVTKHIRHVN